MSAQPAHAADAALNERDGRYLLEAIAWSRTARERGNRPFGAVIVVPSGELLAEAYCNAVRTASSTVDRATLTSATLYSSAGLCVVCAGAIFWFGIGRVMLALTPSACACSGVNGTTPSCRAVTCLPPPPTRLSASAR